MQKKVNKNFKQYYSKYFVKNLAYFRIFAFFDRGNLIVLGNGFQKKTQKTPKTEIDKALKIKSEYEKEKK